MKKFHVIKAMKILFIIGFISSVAYGQMLDYTPSQGIDRTLPLSHYDTDYIYIENISDEVLSLSFELIEENGESGWHNSVCTSAICFVNVPNSGIIGQILPGEIGYISMNFSTNEIMGEGLFRFVITDKNIPEINDTVSFHYIVEDASSQVEQPWARINFNENVVTVLLKNPQFKTSLSIYNVAGQGIVHLPVEAITSFRMDEYEDGIYFVVVRDESGRELAEKILKIGQ